ncbi:MAG: GNAT family N-acetyltransferase [Erysipelotrichaceae bacterium]
MIRNSTIQDVDQILIIYQHAKKYMLENNNPYQWTNNYPSYELIIEDIKQQNSYVYEIDNKILAVFYFKIGTDHTYNQIKGQWLNNKPYGVIHRIAVLTNKKGIAKQCLDYCLNQCPNIKIDTHQANIPMQKFLLKNNFKYCGIIYLDNQEERLAYQYMEEL